MAVDRAPVVAFDILPSRDNDKAALAISDYRLTLIGAAYAATAN